MAKIGCICGHTIVDQTNDIPYKAIFIRDQDRDNYCDYSIVVASFIQAIETGHRDIWIKNYFSESYPVNIDNSSVVFDIVSSYEQKFFDYMYQCTNCGRVMIQIGETNRYGIFTPEDDQPMNLFEGKSTNTDDL